MDGNTAVAHVAYRVNEVCAIFPITPSSTMAELADEWSGKGIPNIWGNVPVVQAMQSEGGAAGAVHGALQSGALTTTFTASQGLLLMLPNMFKIAGELTPTVFHIAARAIATQALSIFGDHSDVMAARTTGFAMLSSASVQEAHDSALISQAATLASRIPFLHFFDGFRTSHEIATIDLLDDAQIRAMIDDDLVRAHRARALTPERPVIRGTAHNADTFFQARETVNPFYARLPAIVQEQMDRFAELTGRQYHLFDYHGAADAERVIVMMGSGVETASATAAALYKQGERVGVLQVRLYRPFAAAAFLAALPRSVRAVAVLEQTKEPGAPGEPLYLDVMNTLAQEASHARRGMPVVIGGRYGLSSKDFNPAMAKAVFDELRKPEPSTGFTVGIIDDVSHTSLTPDMDFRIDPSDLVQAVFYGLGADGTVGANKNSVKIIAEDAGLHAQGYFVYDSHKSGAQTISHLRFGPQPDPGPIPDPAGQLHRLPSVPVRRSPGRAAPGRPGRHRAAEHAVRAGSDLGAPAARDAAAHHRARAAAVCDRCVARGTGRGTARPHQHGAADLLLRHLRRAAARAGDHPHQAGHPQDLRRQGRGQSCRRTSARWTTRWRVCSRSRCRRRQPASGNARPWCRSMRRPSCAT